MLKTSQGIMGTCPMCGKRELDGDELMAVEIKDLPAHTMQVTAKLFGCRDCVQAAGRIYAGTKDSRFFQERMVERALDIIIPAVDKEKQLVARQKEDALKRDVARVKQIEAARAGLNSSKKDDMPDELKAKRTKIERGKGGD